jgi:hypothetical protein
MPTEQQPQFSENPERHTPNDAEIKGAEEEGSRSFITYRSTLIIHFDAINRTLPFNENVRNVLSYGNTYDENSFQGIKRRFWFALFKDQNSNSENSNEYLDNLTSFLDRIEYFETGIIERFVHILKKLILEQRGYEKPFFSFRLSEISYGSLDLALEVSGVKNLAETFNNNIDIFIGLLEMYAPIALVRSLDFHDSYSNSVYSKVEVPQGLELEFARFTRNPVSNSGNPAANDNKLNRFLILAKSSWIIPVVLSFFLLYMLYKDMSDTREFYLKQYDTIIQQQQELIKTQNEYLKTNSDNRKNFLENLLLIDSLKGK